MASIGMQSDEAASAGICVHAKAADIAALEAECAGLRRQCDHLHAAKRDEQIERLAAEERATSLQARVDSLNIAAANWREAVECAVADRDVAARARDVNARVAQEARERADAAERLAHEAEAQREAAVMELTEARAKLARIAEAQRQIEDNAAPLDLPGCCIDHVDVPVCRVGTHTLPLPAYAKPGDAGMDLRTPSDVVVPHGLRKRIPCGFAFAIPEGYEGQVRPKSGLSERCIDVALGTIDSCYRGEVEVVVHNNRVGDWVFKAGDKIAQIVFCPVARATLREVDALDETERGASGFGSSGRA